MIVQQLVPKTESVQLSAVLDNLASTACLPPFSQELISLADDLAAALFSDSEAKRFPELQALAFFIRRSATRSMCNDFIELVKRPNLLRVPCGKVFHLAPGNVDTLFVYSWFLSAIAGNTNIVRLSQHTSVPTAIICRLLNQVLSGYREEVQRSITMIKYGHEEDITQAISSTIDLRVIWGGDRAVSSIRSISLPVHARELVFPDRFSIALINSKVYNELDSNGRLSLVHDFFNDSYWFDQAACSSPRQVFFLGNQEASDEASDSFFSDLEDELLRRNFHLEAGAAMEKLTDVYDCLLQNSVAKLHYKSNELAVLELASADLEKLPPLPDKHPSRGAFYSTVLTDLDDLVPILTKKLQTLTYFGFQHDELRAFAQTVNGQGIDRMVPVGQALAFDRFWDGLDLLSEFTRLVNIK